VCSYSATILLEAELFSTYQDLSLELIRSMAGASCTGGHYLGGFDYPDEWIQYEFDVSIFGYYTIEARVRGEYQFSYLFEVMLTGHPSGETQTTYIPFTGLGYG
jgi:hypothetical protein